MNKKVMIAEIDNLKLVRSDDYNYTFNKRTGFFSRWGKTEEDDPTMAPAPEIADIEISTICNMKCKACYKTNTDCGINMSIDTLSSILDKFPKILTQVAYGIGSVKGNPDLWKILDYTRNKGIIPNITINGHNIDSSEIDKLSELCGAIAVSNYNTDECYDSVNKIANASLKRTVKVRRKKKAI